MYSGLEVAPELTTICNIGADIQGMSEINKPWTAGNKALYKALYKLQLDTLFRQSNPAYLSAPWRSDASASREGT